MNMHFHKKVPKAHNQQYSRTVLWRAEVVQEKKVT